jgi:hypothetical protein
MWKEEAGYKLKRHANRKKGKREDEDNNASAMHLQSSFLAA